MSREVFTHQNRYLPNTSFYSHIKTQSKMHIVLFLSVGTSPSLVTCCSMADASDRAFTCVSGAVAERFFVYMAMANPNFESVPFSVQRDAGSDGSLTAEKLERPVALGSFSHGLMKKMNAQNRGG